MSNLGGRVGTGLKILGCELHRAFKIKLGSGSGINNLRSWALKVYWLLHKNKAIESKVSSGLYGLRKIVGLGFFGLMTHVLQAQSWAWAYGLGPRPVPALLVGLCSPLTA